jgi:L-galactose dehydrogenase/L-glyceraldehyde 3-phosphate reductase
MKFRPLGTTGLHVSEIGFGCGDNAGLMIEGDPRERLAVVQRAIEAGINYFDTAGHYGAGRSELNLGAALKTLGAHPIVATKLRLREEDLNDIPAAVRREFDASLERLQMESVDLYYLHTRVAAERRMGAGGLSHVGILDLTGPIWETFSRLKGEGRVRFLGVCTTGAELPAIREVLATLPIDVIQAQYNIFNPTEVAAPPGFQGPDHGQTIVQAKARGIGVVVYRALAAGALAQRQGAPVRSSPSRGNAAWEADLERASALDFLRGEDDATLAGAAVRFALSSPIVSNVLLGFSRLSYVDQANGYSEAGPLSEGQIGRIEAQYAGDFGRLPVQQAGV